MSSVSNNADVPWQEQDNPFLVNMPVVHVVRSIRAVADGEVTTADVAEQRVLTRVGNNRVYPKVVSDNKEVLARTGAAAILGGVSKLLPH